jgi:hypothetical protein
MVRRRQTQKLQKLMGLCRQEEEGFRVRGVMRQGQGRELMAVRDAGTGYIKQTGQCTRQTGRDGQDLEGDRRI